MEIDEHLRDSMQRGMMRKGYSVYNNDGSPAALLSSFTVEESRKTSKRPRKFKPDSHASQMEISLKSLTDTFQVLRGKKCCHCSKDGLGVHKYKYNGTEILLCRQCRKSLLRNGILMVNIYGYDSKTTLEVNNRECQNQPTREEVRVTEEASIPIIPTVEKEEESIVVSPEPIEAPTETVDAPAETIDVPTEVEEEPDCLAIAVSIVSEASKLLQAVNGKTKQAIAESQEFKAALDSLNSLCGQLREATGTESIK